MTRCLSLVLFFRDLALWNIVRLKVQLKTKIFFLITILLGMAKYIYQESRKFCLSRKQTCKTCWVYD